jgi:hypothetical protein
METGTSKLPPDGWMVEADASETGLAMLPIFEPELNEIGVVTTE